MKVALKPKDITLKKMSKGSISTLEPSQYLQKVKYAI